MEVRGKWIGHGIAVREVERSRTTLPWIVTVKYMTSSLNISTPMPVIPLILKGKKVQFSEAQLPLFNLERDWLSMSYFSQDRQACLTGNRHFIHSWPLCLSASWHLVRRCSRKCLIENIVNWHCYFIRQEDKVPEILSIAN